MIQTIEKFCSEKRLRFGYGFEGGLNDFFSRDANGVYVIIGRPRVGVTEGDVVLRGNAVQYRDELAAMLGRNGNRVSRSDNRLHVVFRIARPMSSGGTGYQPTPPTPPTPSVTPLYFEAKQANSTLSFYSLMSDVPSFEYSEDGTTWEEWTYTDMTDQGVTAHIFNTITLENIGDKVYLRGTNTALSDENNTMVFFTMTGSFDGGGNVTSLLDGDGSSTSIPDYGFYGLFYDRVHSGNAALVTPPSFGDVTTIGLGGCNSMYYACGSMTSAPDMSKIVSIGERGCSEMFTSTSISKAADMDALSTIGEEGLRSMYYDTEIVTPANMGNVTSFGDNACGEMYYDGSILIENGVLTFDFPALPITDGGGNTYSTPQEVADWMTYAG